MNRLGHLMLPMLLCMSAATTHAGEPLEPLVPALAEAPYRLAPGPRPFQHRLAVSPAVGVLGSERLFALRAAYHPDRWLGYEATIAHNPAQSTHALVHTLSAQVRRPVSGRLQPYGSVGFGMLVVLPGTSINADPVTKTLLAMGGGLECYIRDDLALRGEMRRATVFGREQNREGVVAFSYLEATLGLSFYRSIRP